MSWFVYLLRCRDGSLYAGITTDLSRRLREHAGEGGRGAKYTAAHAPLGFAAAWAAPDRSSASRLEARLKRLSRSGKESAAEAGTDLASLCGCVPVRIHPDGTVTDEAPEIL